MIRKVGLIKDSNLTLIPRSDVSHGNKNDFEVEQTGYNCRANSHIHAQ